MIRRLPTPVIALAGALLLTACGGGGGGGGDGSSTGGGTGGGGANTAPEVSAGADRTIAVSSIGLEGTASDADGDPLDYRWRLIESASVGPVHIAGERSPTPTVSFPLVGDYVLELRVDDGSTSSTDRVRVRVDGSDALGFSGTVHDDDVAVDSVAVTLRWTPVATALLTTSSDGSGAWSFAGLKGDPDEFVVDVAGR